jgi:hypothetical protein
MVQKHVQNLTSLSEQLLATHTLLKQENDKMKRTLSGRKERKTGKCHVVKYKNIISTEEVYDDIKAAENATVAKKKGSKKRKLSTSGEAET